MTSIDYPDLVGTAFWRAFFDHVQSNRGEISEALKHIAIVRAGRWNECATCELRKELFIYREPDTNSEFAYHPDINIRVLCDGPMNEQLDALGLSFFQFIQNGRYAEAEADYIRIQALVKYENNKYESRTQVPAQ